MKSGGFSSEVRFPMEVWVESRFRFYINKKINEYASKNKLTRELLHEGLKNSSALCDAFMEDYFFAYKYRRHSDVSEEVGDIKHLTDLVNHSTYKEQDLYWSDSFFSGSLIEYILSGEFYIKGANLVGELTDVLVKPLLDFNPPMQQEIIITLHDNISYFLAGEVYSVYRQCSDELLFSLRSEVTQVLIKKTKSYILSFQERDNSLSINYVHSDLGEYDLWFTSKGTPEHVKRLMNGVEEKLKSLLRNIIVGLGDSPGLITDDELTVAEEKYNEILTIVQFYWGEVDFCTLMDRYCLEEIQNIGKLKLFGVSELTSDQMTLTGIMFVKAEYKYLKGFTMREIALGLPNKDAGLLSSLSYDYDGVTKKLHSNTFESMIRRLPDIIEQRLNTRADLIENDNSIRDKIKSFYRISCWMVVNEFFTSDLMKSTPALKYACDNFLKGYSQPQLINIRGRKLADLIAIPAGTSGGYDTYLFVSILTGECRVIVCDFNKIKDDVPLQKWIFQHLAAYDRQEVVIKNSFDEYRYVLVGNFVMKLNNTIPLEFTNDEDYPEALCDRYVEKFRSDTDALIKTSDEKARAYFIEFITLSASSLCLVPATSLLGIVTQFIMGSVIIAVADIVKFYDKGNQERKFGIFWNVLVSLLSALLVNAQLVVKALRHYLYAMVKRQLLFTGTDTVKKLLHCNPLNSYMDETYRNPRNLLTQGSNSSVYVLNNEFLIKDYKKLLRGSEALTALSNGRSGFPVYNNSLIEANNNAVAMNRLYGEGSARVVIFNGSDHYTKLVSLVMRRIPGYPLSSILNNNHKELKAALLNKLYGAKIESVVTETLSSLKSNGIAHNDINLANIIYDSRMDKLRLVDFDSAIINPAVNSLIAPVNTSKYELMASKLTADLTEFRRSCV